MLLVLLVDFVVFVAVVPGGEFEVGGVASSVGSTSAFSLEARGRRLLGLRSIVRRSFLRLSS